MSDPLDPTGRAPGDSYRLFNLESMSGVSPGARSKLFQRVRLEPVAGGPRIWARLLWYGGRAQDPDDPTLEGATCLMQRQTPGRAEEWEDALLAQVEPTPERPAVDRIPQTLAAAGLRLRACGACAHWQPTGAQTEQGLPLGRCTHAGGTDGAPPPPASLAAQSCLALDCPHWQALDESAPRWWSAPAPPAADDPAAIHTDPLPKAAELDRAREKRPWWRKLGDRLTGAQEAHPASSDQEQWEARLVERSGVGAGTEPCFACQGRIANLGALTVATAEDDKQTYSVWRCRSCRSTYLNSWIDRWERLDSLETEETYFRISPAEAVEILAVIQGVVGGEHPAGRQERTVQRAWLVGFTAHRPILSHQIRQGR